MRLKVIVMLDISDRYSSDEKVIKVQTNCDRIISYFHDYRGSLRMAEAKLGISRSTIHRYIHTYIKQDYNDSYGEITSLMKYNKRYRCKPRRYWQSY
nr:MAG TPA: winged helix-turn-helix protein [Caudoviricetes sp.]